MIPYSFPGRPIGQTVRPRGGAADGAAIYFCNVSAVRHLLPRLRPFLNPDETARFGTYRQEADRERFLLGRALLRLFVGDILEVESRAVPLQFTSAGKPIISSGGLHVNVSHSGNVVAFALAERPVGLDVEAISEAVPWEAMTIAFSPHERARLSRIAGDERRRIFYEIWTRKEALLKADGRGLHDDLPSLETIRSDGSWRRSVRLGGVTFRLAAIAAPPGAIAAAAYPGSLGRINRLVVTVEHLRILAARSFARSRAAAEPVRLVPSPSREACSSAAPAESAARSG